MAQRQYSEEEKQIFYHERFFHPHPRVQLKMEIMQLKSQGIKNSQIARLTKVCENENTVRKYIKDYEEGGIDKLKEIRFYQPKSELENHKESLKKYLESNPPMSIKEATAKIEEITGIKRSETQIRKLIKNMGMKYLKVGHIPGKANIYFIWKSKEVPIYAPINVSLLQDFPLIETGKMEKN